MLHPEDQLPTAREVVEQLAINPNTVLKAYRELERDGLVEGRPGQGTFVRQGVAGPSLGPESPLRGALAQWVRDARAVGLDEDAIRSLLAEALAHTEPAEETSTRP